MNRPGREETANKIMDMVTEMFCNSAGYDKSTTVRTDARLQDELGFDSVMLIVLQINLEDAFHIRFNPTEDDSRQIFMSIETLTDYVLSHMGE